MVLTNKPLNDALNIEYKLVEYSNIVNRNDFSKYDGIILEITDTNQFMQ